MWTRSVRRAGTSLVAALLVALAACGDRGRGDQADTTGAAQVGGTVVGADTLKAPGPPTPPVSAQADTAAERDTAGGARGRPRPVPDTLGRRLRTDTAGPRPRLPVPAPTRDTAAPAAAQPPRDPYHQPPRDTVSAVVYEGWKYYNLNCARCHGEDVLGTTIAPHLIESFRSGKVDRAEYDRVVHGSRVARGMPSWTGLLEDEKLDAIYQYVRGRSEGKIGPGRPARAAG